jgi:hypothetical protein
MDDPYMTRASAAAYLSKKLGRTVTVGSLHRHASEATGPCYVICLGRASYTRQGLDAWVATLAKVPTKRPRSRPLTRKPTHETDAC